MKRISIFGATGSIGQNTCDLISRSEPGAYQVELVSGARNIACLAQTAQRLRARCAITSEPDLYDDLHAALAGTDIEIAAGREALLEAAQRPVDCVVSAIVGAAGLAPGYHALAQGARLALANKESMVAAGPLMRQMAKAHGGAILPVDSEHSAIFQLLHGQDQKNISHVTLTASGGAFRDMSLEKLAHVTPEQAATHPTWDMGQRITIDSASLFNKALEVIEAKEIFQFEPDRIKVLVHPQSLVHALVEFVDRGILAHLGPHDMRHAIGYALCYPQRQPLDIAPLDLAQVGNLSFAEPDAARYPALGLAYDVMRAGGHFGAVFNAAKEIALDAFIARQIGFLQMAKIVATLLEQMQGESAATRDSMSLETVLEVDHLTRIKTREYIASHTGA